jgi:hypothetical protein
MSGLYPELRRPPPLFPLLEVFAGFRILPGSIRTQSKSLVTRIGNSHPGWQGFAGKGKGISMIRPERAPYSPRFQRLAAVHERPKRALGLCALRHPLQRTRESCLIHCTRFQSAVLSHQPDSQVREIDRTRARFRGAETLVTRVTWQGRHWYQNRQRKTGHLSPKPKRVPFINNLKSCSLRLYFIPARGIRVF